MMDAGPATSSLGKERIVDQSAEDWCRANIHAECVPECVITLRRTMVETLGDLLFLVPSARALHLLDMSAEASQALWNALALCSGEQARQQLEVESATSTATGDEVTGFAAPKVQEARQKHTGMKTPGHSQRKNAGEPVVQDKCRETAHKSIKRQTDKQKKTAAEVTKDTANGGLLSGSRQSKSLFRSQLKHERGQSAKASKPKTTTKASGSAPEDESARSISQSDGDTECFGDRSPRPREKPPPVGGRSPSRSSPRSLSHDDRRMARERLASMASKSVRKRRGALTPPLMSPMTPTRPTARISRLQHLATPSPVRRAQLEPSPDVDHRSGGPTLSRAERLKAQERLLSPAVPRESESPERSAVNVRSPPSYALDDGIL